MNFILRLTRKRRLDDPEGHPKDPSTTEKTTRYMRGNIDTPIRICRIYPEIVFMHTGRWNTQIGLHHIALKFVERLSHWSCTKIHFPGNLSSVLYVFWWQSPKGQVVIWNVQFPVSIDGSMPPTVYLKRFLCEILCVPYTVFLQKLVVWRRKFHTMMSIFSISCKKFLN